MFQPKYSKKELAEIGRIVAGSAGGRAAGIRLAAAAFDTSVDAIRRLLNRQHSPRVAAEYAVRARHVAERRRLAAAERDVYTLQEAVDTFSRATAKPLDPIIRHEATSGLREATAVALLSDVHCEETVRPGETPTGNAYSLQIADVSIARFFGGYRWLIDFHRHAFRVGDVVLWLGGDLITGHIHEELKETAAMPPIEAVLWLRARLLSGIDLLLEDPLINKLHVVCSYGNHGRTTHKPYRAQGAAHSYEWLLYQWLASQYEKNPRVVFLADQSAHQYLKVYDWQLHFHHGDETSYGGGVGGITIPLNKATSQWDLARRCDYHNFGHWHQYMDTGRIAVNGSMIGYNAYAMSIKATPEPAQQSFYLIDSKRGKTCKSPIWVRE